MKEGQLVAIWIKRGKLGPMDPARSATAKANLGLVGNANQGGSRQVTVIEEEVFQKVSELLHKDVDPSVRRANLLVRGVDLQESRGRILQVGSMRLQILGETRPCERMEQAVSGLRSALSPDWRGGVYGTVLNDAELEVGDPVFWAAEA